MSAVIQTMQKYSTGKVVSVLFVLTMIVYSSMLLFSIPAVSMFAPEMPIFDLSPAGYSFDYANALLSKLGAEGRDVYLYTQLPLDFIYPGLFSITYSLLLVWLLAKLFIDNSKVYYVAFVPFMAGVFDYIENVYIISMINSFPDLQAATVNVSSFFTVLKSGFTMLFFVLLMIAFMLLLKKRLLNTKNQ